jgi:hypothetical protein
LKEAQKRYYFQFAADILTSQTLGVKDAAALEARIRAYLDANNIIEARSA